MSKWKRWLFPAMSLGILAALAVVLLSASASSGLGTELGSAQPALLMQRSGLSFVGLQPELGMPAHGEAAADGQQSFFGDLNVEPGQTLNGNVIVYDGDVTIQRDGRIGGDLVVYRGDVEVPAGRGAAGNVTAFSGDVDVAGEIGGNLAALNGDVTLESSARVNGNVSLLNGELERSEGAFVGGNVVRGPSLDLPAVPGFPLPFPGVPGMAQDAIGASQRSFVQSFGVIVVRVIGAGLLALLIGLLVTVITLLRPERVEQFRMTWVDEPALSFVTGIVANLGLLFLAVLFAVTICLVPLTIVLLLVLAVLNLAGWAAISSAVGRRATVSAGWSTHPEYAAGLAAVVLTGGLGLLWAMGGCFRFIGMATALIVASVGAGAVLLPFIRRRMKGPAGTRAVKAVEPEPVTPVVSAVVAEAASSTDATGQQTTAAIAPEYQAGGDFFGAETEAASKEDDFLSIRGLGPVSVTKLREAGVRTFGELAILTPEQAGEILGWTAERVVRSGIIDRSRELAAS